MIVRTGGDRHEPRQDERQDGEEVAVQGVQPSWIFQDWRVPRPRAVDDLLTFRQRAGDEVQLPETD
ncbi:hypothetical protein GCM10012275_21180 [Longimycelium tulufanense]|uniref:Uncharacterized protein n=1 Tax=Longimycelium tulufanense TaxID=907463 RepID=A0A8J3CDH3_9PSEU|nr:hypothetical protein GCM10012275_21180 [Longimycelium tulufanense]